MEYLMYWEISLFSYSSFKNNLFLSIILLFLLIIIVKMFWKFKCLKTFLILFYFLFIFIVANLIFFVQFYNNYLNYKKYINNDYKFTEGVIENFSDDLRTEKFRINNLEFLYTHSIGAPGFTQTNMVNGPLGNGVPVAIYYCDKNKFNKNIILRIDIEKNYDLSKYRTKRNWFFKLLYTIIYNYNWKDNEKAQR